MKKGKKKQTNFLHTQFPPSLKCPMKKGKDYSVNGVMHELKTKYIPAPTIDQSIRITGKSYNGDLDTITNSTLGKLSQINFKEIIIEFVYHSLTIEGYHIESSLFPCNWSLSASCDGKSWITLDEQHLFHSRLKHNWFYSPHQGQIRYIKFLFIDSQIKISNIELYGTVFSG